MKGILVSNEQLVEDLRNQAANFIKMADLLETHQKEFDMLALLTSCEVSLTSVHLVLFKKDEPLTKLVLNTKDFPTLEKDIQTLCCGYRKISEAIINNLTELAGKKLK
jgi:hypothetical protein